MVPRRGGGRPEGSGKGGGRGGAGGGGGGGEDGPAVGAEGGASGECCPRLVNNLSLFTFFFSFLGYGFEECGRRRGGGGVWGCTSGAAFCPSFAGPLPRDSNQGWSPPGR